KEILSSFTLSKIINLVGQARPGKTTLALLLYRYLLSEEKDVEFVDIGLVYRAYALFIKEKLDKGDTAVISSEENIIFELKKASVEVRDSKVYLNGRYVSDKELHASQVEDILSKITKDKPKVVDFLREKDREIVRSISSQGKWVIISSRGFYPFALLNVYLYADLKERAKRALKAEGKKIDEGSKDFKNMMERLKERDRRDRSDKNLRNYPGLFIVVDTTSKKPMRIFKEVKGKLRRRLHEEEELVRKRLSVLEKLINSQDKAIMLFKGGKGGALEKNLMKKLTNALKKDFEVRLSYQLALNPYQVVKRWGKTGLKVLVEKLKDDQIPQETIKVGLSLLEEENGWEFERWIDGIRSSYPESKNANALWFAFHYLSGNAKIVVIENKENKSYEKLLEHYQITKERLKERMKELNIEELKEMKFQDFTKFVIVGETNILKSHKGSLRELVGKELKEGCIKRMLVEGKNIGISEGAVGNACNAVHIASFEELVREVSTFNKEEIEILSEMLKEEEKEKLESKKSKNVEEVLEREQLREYKIPQGDQNSIETLYKKIESLYTPSEDNFYEALKRNLPKELNPIQVLENLLSRGEFLKVFPELEELKNVSYPLHHSRFNMFKHSLNALRRIYYIEEASRVDENSKEFEEAFLGYKQDVAGLEDLSKETFKELVNVYKKALKFKLETSGRDEEIDKKLFLSLCILFHDIGKNISVQQHITFGKPLAEKVFKRLGFNKKDIKLATFLITNHSLYTRLFTGYDTYLGLKKQLKEIGVSSFEDERAEAVLSLIAMMNVADIGSVGYGFEFTPSKLREILLFFDKKYAEERAKISLEETISERLGKLLDDAFKVKEIMSILEQTGKKNFKRFLAEISLYYAMPQIGYLSAKSFVNLFYILYIYKFSKGYSISYPLIYFFSERAPLKEEVEATDKVLKDKELWKENKFESLSSYNLEINKSFEREDKIVVKFKSITADLYLPKEQDYILSYNTSLYEAFEKAIEVISEVD
ncbi:hypothetical protein DRQ11_12550, partial [candidate division KSB1 bacterium]